MNPATDIIFSRFRLIVIALAILAGLVVVQLLRIDLTKATAEHLRPIADSLSQSWREFEPERGQIYDRNGELLATNDVQYELGISPPNVTDIDEVVETLSDLLDTSSTDLRDKLTDALAQDHAYLFIERPVSAEVGNAIKALRESGEKRLNGVDLAPIPHRVYPGGALAAQVLGFVGYNDDGRQVGYFGVEGFYNDLLAGRPVEGIEYAVPFEAQRDPTPDQGADLYLTLDRDVQYAVEVAMADAINQYGAEGGTIVVMNPKTGEILGMASWPTFDPNNYVDFPPSEPANPAVSGQYEPGSTFKILTMAAAMDAGTVKPETAFVDSGVIEVGGVLLTNWDGGAWGPVDMTGCLQHSLNVCFASIATWMGPKDFYNYLAAFGIGHITNVDLDAERSGHLKRPGDSDWYDSDLGTNSFGQGVAVTPLQLLTAASAVANGGAMMQPHILLRVQDGEAQRIVQPQILGRPIRPDTAALLNEMLAQSLERGEGSEALIDGYRIAGKTGTAQIPLPTGYDENDTIASFIGWGPADDPQFIVLVKLDRPSTSIWGSETAAPLFAQLTQRLVVLLQIPPDATRHTLTGQ